jgi:hypothetical protein
MEVKAEYIRSISTWDSGGGINIDVIELTDGRVLGITDESVVLYKNMESLEEGETDAQAKTIILK